MECNIARKKLKDYAKGNIIDINEKHELEEHIKDCAICKRELYLWQDVIEKQKVLSEMQRNIPTDLRNRLKYRLNNLEKEQLLPPAVHKLRAIGKIWSDAKGRLIIEILIILASLVVLVKHMHSGKGLLVPFLIIFGFLVIFIIMLKGRK